MASVEEPAIVKQPSGSQKVLNAIALLNERTGSSVAAIMKYMKANGHEVANEKRQRASILKLLKQAVEAGQVERVKNSFKLSTEHKKTIKSIEKMKAHAEKKKAKAQAKKDNKIVKTTVKSSTKAERMTKEPVKKKTKPGDSTSAKAIAGAAAQDALAKRLIEGENETATPKQPKKKKENGASSKKAKAANENTGSKSAQGGGKSHPTNKPRKSIGTLAQPMSKSKMSRKSLKKLIAGKPVLSDEDS
ncbi:histone H1 isoform X1 [Scaptodrosophila lebanonensis]|uniref:Histone H1 isoform X1 n=1 Tax=Drosophila lebanonensis TaxID=7225 RepID=A0A6J2T893_DROLE|nr:histone H1 isoform X1 [Scaptodrosophila lebanonensis]